MLVMANVPFVCRRTLAISRELGDRAIEAQVCINIHYHTHYHILSLIINNHNQSQFMNFQKLWDWISCSEQHI